MQQGNLQSPAMCTLRQRVGECAAGEGGGAAGRCLVGHALGALRRLAAQPGTKAISRVFETPHPYQNRMVSERASGPVECAFKVLLDLVPLSHTTGTTRFPQRADLLPRELDSVQQPCESHRLDM